MRFYFDFISPYAYLAWNALPRFTKAIGEPVEPVPILFAALLNAHGHKGPAEIPPKREYIFKQCLRIAAREQITLAPPAAHPFNPLLGLRIASLRSLSLADRTRLVDTLFDATWGAAGDGIDSADKVRAALDGAGMASDELIEAATTDDNKRRLTETTNAAVRSGVFGVPTMELDGELFWGYDALPDLELFARGEDPVRVADLERWRDLPVGASRR